MRSWSGFNCITRSPQSVGRYDRLVLATLPSNGIEDIGTESANTDGHAGGLLGLFQDVMLRKRSKGRRLQGPHASTDRRWVYPRSVRRQQPLGSQRFTPASYVERYHRARVLAEKLNSVSLSS